MKETACENIIQSLQRNIHHSLILRRCMHLGSPSVTRPRAVPAPTEPKYQRSRFSSMEKSVRPGEDGGAFHIWPSKRYELMSMKQTDTRYHDALAQRSFFIRKLIDELAKYDGLEKHVVFDLREAIVK